MVNIGIISPSEIALRRFMPALSSIPTVKYIGIAHANSNEWFGNEDGIDTDFKEEILEKELKKARRFQEEYGGKVFESYSSLLESDEIDAIYLPLPPALHYKWAKMALLYNKHIIIEKPATTNYSHTKELVDIAKKRGLTIHENYMFIFHSQLAKIEEIINSDTIGHVRLYRISFGFPKRPLDDFRYNKALGGGALMDCGGYTLRYATMLLGSSIKIATAQLNYIQDFEVDLYGSATLVNSRGTTIQVAFGMDNSYKCELEIWGNKGCLTTERILTAPVDYVPTASIRTNEGINEITLPADDTFKKSIIHFINSISNSAMRAKNYNDIDLQSQLMEDFMNISNKK